MTKAERIVEWLKAHEAVQYGESPWPTVQDNEDVYLVDFPRLFPTRNPRDRGEDSWDILDDDWADGDVANANELGNIDGTLREALESDRPTEQDGGNVAERLGWDTCAWYQPMHFFGHDWGIFIRKDCIIENATWVARFLRHGTPFSPTLRKALIRAGFAALFLHEQFHHKVESLGIRLHVVERTSRFLPYQNKVYRPTYGTDDNLEEALANADAFLRAKTKPYVVWMGKSVVAALQAYLKWRYPFDPPGYRRAVSYLTNARLNRGIDRLHGQVQEGILKPSRPATDWEIATRLHQSLFKVTDHLWEVVPRARPTPLLPGAAPYPSISSRQLIKMAEKFGWSIETGRGKGSHIFLSKPHAPSLTIPANRRDLSPGVVRTALKAFNRGLYDIPALLNMS